jgi:TolB-like protein/DNA-binding winged helix-turn-helix (wHTH) protein/Tfp pilus assembly protein PilF
MLIEHRDRPVTKQELIESVWKDTAVTDDVLVQSVGDVRRLLSDDARNPRFIKTLSKVGYRLVGPVEEVTPEPAADHSPELELNGRSSSPVWKLASAGGLVIAAALAVIQWGPGAIAGASRAMSERPSIAVLPFANLTGNPEFEYLSDGVTDEVANLLMTTGRLRVVARSSSFQYKGTSHDVRSIGSQLNADLVLEGSLRKSGETWEIIGQLSRTSDGYGLWSRRYEQTSNDLPAAASDLAHDAAGSLKINLPAGIKRRQISAQAHDLYLKGRFLWAQRRQELLLNSVTMFQQAISIQPDYALAYAGLADSYATLLANDGDLGARDLAAKANDAAHRAIELDPTLSDPHAALASVHCDYDWDWKGAESEFRRAIALNPDSSTAHHWYGGYLAHIRHFDEALRELETAVRLDPLSRMDRVNLAGAYIQMKQYDLALAKLHEALDLDVNFQVAHVMIAIALARKGAYQESAVEFKLGRGLKPDDPDPIDVLVTLYGYAGRIREARDLVYKMEAMPEWAARTPFQNASLYATAGDADRAFRLLDVALDRRWEVRGIQTDDRWSRLRDDPRYKAALRRIGFPD